MYSVSSFSATVTSGSLPVVTVTNPSGTIGAVGVLDERGDDHVFQGDGFVRGADHVYLPERRPELERTSKESFGGRMSKESHKAHIMFNAIMDKLHQLLPSRWL